MKTLGVVEDRGVSKHLVGWAVKHFKTKLSIVASDRIANLPLSKNPSRKIIIQRMTINNVCRTEETGVGYLTKIENAKNQTWKAHHLKTEITGERKIFIIR